MLGFALGLFLALHYPLLPPLMVGVFAAGAVLFFIFPRVWLVAVPALLPLIGLAPWTGWIGTEELDLLVLAVAAGSYARVAYQTLREPRHPGPSSGKGEARPNALVWFVVFLFAISTLVAMVRGMQDAGSFDLDWFQGYHEPLNSLRLAKPLFLALLLIPLWRHAARRAPEVAEARLVLGLMLGLAGASLATVWERMAYTGLLNFSADYRTTGLFWEMHVGGAALDGFLALTVPFAIYTLLSDKHPQRWVLAIAIAAVAGYSCLTTFSRGVYLAVPIGIALMLGLQAAQRRRSGVPPPLTAGSATPAPAPVSFARAVMPAVVLIACFVLGAGWMFATSGYRGMLALLGAMALLLALPAILQRFRIGDWLAGIALGFILSGIAAAGAWLLPKGAYFMYTAAFAASVAAFYVTWRRTTAKKRRGWFAPLALGAFMATITGVALVAYHWGDSAGLGNALPAVATVLVLGAIAGKPGRPAWPSEWRWQSMVLATMAMSAGVIGVFGGGVYMADRFSTGGKDFGGRLEHWRHGVAALATPADWALGKGMGRFPSALFFADAKEHPGDYRLLSEGRNNFLTVTAGQHITGWGEILRISQRVGVPRQPLVLTADVRAAGEVGLHFEVCEKHLLYNAGCLVKQTIVKPQPGSWQRVQVQLDGSPLSHGAWYAPKLLMFSMAVSTRGGRADIDNVALSDSRGEQVLANGDFSQGMARWFFSSDRHHMPWHIKSMIMNVLFDQGVLGLLLWTGLCAGAMWRVSIGHARTHALAPPLAGALAGFAVVGLFDSLLDVPRVAFCFYFLLLLALTIRPPRSVTTSGNPRSQGGSGTSRPARLPIGAAAGAVLLAALLLCAWPGPVSAAPASAADRQQHVLRVGPTRALTSIAQASRQARAGDTIEVDSGEYRGDVAVWTQDNLTLRAVGGRVRLLAQGAAAESKGIWVVRAANFEVQGFDFEGAAVPSRNGAGIRFDKGSMRVRDCSFKYNEMGLLTGNDPDSVLEVEDSEFAHNQRPDGHNHNLYVGQIARLSIQGSYLHHARTGHLLKSRAALNHVLYNRLTDETGGTASYELEFPNGGVAYVIGNIVQQNSRTENPHMISFGAEGYKWPANEIYVVNNTLIDDRPEQGVFLRVTPGATVVQAVNNLLVGRGALGPIDLAKLENNLRAREEDFTPDGQYQLRAASPLAGKAVDAGQTHGRSLMPQREYLHPRGSRELGATAHNPGAVQRMARPPG